MAKKKTISAEEPFPGAQDCSTPKEKALNFKVKLKCKNTKQKEFFNILKERNKDIVFGVGSAGAGKTYVAMSEALSELRDGLCEKIIFITPTTEAGSSATRIGLLPGTAEEKISPYLENMRDTVAKILRTGGNHNPEETARNLIKDEKVVIKLMNYARGTTYDNSVVIIDEGENFSKSEMLLLLTRIGENTRYFILGSEQQCDRKDIKSEGKSGMMYAREKLSGLEEVGSVEFTDEDVVRNPLISKILKLWE
jgi:phosphate starvation-inducible PhoH-like protein